MTPTQQAIKALRKVIHNESQKTNRGKAIAYLAERTGIKAWTIYRIIRGECPTMNSKTFDKLCEYFGFTLVVEDEKELDWRGEEKKELDWKGE